jgi:hypothetical protein
MAHQTIAPVGQVTVIVVETAGESNLLMILRSDDLGVALARCSSQANIMRHTGNTPALKYYNSMFQLSDFDLTGTQELVCAQ